MKEQYIRQLMIFMVTILALVTLAFSASDSLLTISRSNSCLKALVADFVRAEDCSLLSDQTKVKLSMKMTECLLLEMNKPFPADCHDYSCKLEGDAWSTFTTFFAHIDNLCHFYWQTLHHERSEALISKLSQSSFEAESALRENTLQTKKILSMQHKLHENIDESLRSQSQMSALLNSSSKRLANLTAQMETFIETIHKELNDNYASLRNILEIINEGVTKVVQIQGYIRAEVTSVAGVVFFLSQFLCVVFFTTRSGLEIVRLKIIVILVGEILIELAFSRFISTFVGITWYRYFFILLKLAQLFLASKPDHQKQEPPVDPFTTPRLKRAFRKAIEQEDNSWENSRKMSAIAAKVISKLDYQGESGREIFI